MTPERWERVAEIYQAALLLEPAERATFVVRSARGDDELRREVDSLLAQEQARLLLDEPLDVAAAAVLADEPRLAPDTIVGSYRVISLLGQGGMGQVYRAYDTKLHRDVALKILPDTFLHDPERLARFRREAHVLASLNHPNVAAIYGFEDSGDIHALVLELVEGPTLADRIASGPLAIDEALSVARQIAEALEAAHEHGIVHRDLKPSNITIREDGTVKVLDFGLAKPSSGCAGVADSIEAGLDGRATASPTILSPAVTTTGIILGTAGYMSPEQAKGKAAGKRSDIWAFGCVLYEMLTGQRAFDGEDVSDTIASVLRGEPDWKTLPASLPSPLSSLLRGCLEKDPRKRIADISVPLFLLRDSTLASADAGAGVTGRRVLDRRASVLIAVGVLLAAAVGAALTWGALRDLSQQAAQPVTRLEVPLGEQGAFTFPGRHLVAISPDGRWLAYVANNLVYLRELGSLDARPVRLTGSRAGAREPFFSPDGQWLGFWHDGALKKVRVTGGAPEEIGKAENLTGVNWEPNGDIVFGQGNDGIWLVSSTGGAPRRIVATDQGQVAHGPQILPGNLVLFTLLDGADFLWNDAQIVVQSLGTGERRVLFRGGTDARYFPPNHILYVTNGTLVAAPFNVATLAIGDPVATVPDVAESSNNVSGAAHYGLSANGTLVHLKGSFRAVPHSLLAWVDRHGGESVLAVEPRPYVQPRVSPDGKRIAVGLRDREQNIAIVDLERPRVEPLTDVRGRVTSPVWRNRQEVLFGLARAGNADLWAQIVPKSEPPRQLTDAPYGEIPTSVSSDGATVVTWDPNVGALRTLSLAGEPNVRMIVDGGPARNGEISPDSRCLAYEAGDRVYVRPLGSTGMAEQVSTEGGLQPAWGPDGSELFYVSPTGGLVRTPARTQPACKTGAPQSFINGPYVWSIPSFEGARFYDIAPDGRRFLLLKPVSEQPPVPKSIVVVQNWFQEWKGSPAR